MTSDYEREVIVSQKIYEIFKESSEMHLLVHNIFSNITEKRVNDQENLMKIDENTIQVFKCLEGLRNSLLNENKENKKHNILKDKIIKNQIDDTYLSNSKESDEDEKELGQSNFGIIDSSKRLEEINALNMDDQGKMDLLIDYSISFLKDSVLTESNRSNTSLEIQLKQVFFDFGHSLSKLTKEAPIVVEMESNDLNTQIENLTNEINSLKAANIETAIAKEANINLINELQFEVSNLKSYSESLLENSKLLQNRIEELENIKIPLHNDNKPSSFSELGNFTLSESSTEAVLKSTLELEENPGDSSINKSEFASFNEHSGTVIDENIKEVQSQQFLFCAGQSENPEIQINYDAQKETIDDLKYQLSSKTGSFNQSQIRVKELETDKEKLEIALKTINNEIEEVRLEVVELKIDLESCQLKLEVSDEDKVKLSHDLSNNNNALQLLEKERNELQCKCEEIEHKFTELSIENKQLKEINTNNVFKDELELLRGQLDEATKEKDIFAKKLNAAASELVKVKERLSEEDTHVNAKEQTIISLRDEIKVLTSTLDVHTSELDSSLEECIKVTEENGRLSDLLKESEKNYVRVCADLKFANEERERILEDKVTVEKYLNSCIDNSEKKCQEISKNVNVLEEKIEVLEAEGNLGKKTFDDLNKIYSEVKIELWSLREENIATKNVIDNLEAERLALKETLESSFITLLEKDKEISLKEGKISKLESEIAIIKTGFEQELNNSSNKLSEVTDKLNTKDKDLIELAKHFEELNNKHKKSEQTTLDLKAELRTEIETTQRALAEIRDKTEQIEKLTDELTIYREKVTKTIEYEEVLEAANGKVLKLESELSLQEKELQHRRKEIERLSKSLADTESLQSELNNVQEALASCEKDLKDNAFLLRSTENKLREKVLEKDECVKKCQESFGIQQKLKTQVNALKTKESEEREKCGDLRRTLEKIKGDLAQKEKEFDKVDKDYSELKIRYLQKRQTTNDLQTKYDKIYKYCKENNIVFPT